MVRVLREEYTRIYPGSWATILWCRTVDWVTPHAWLPPRTLTADRLVLALAALVIVLAAASSEEPATMEAQRDLDAVAIVILAAAAAALLISGRFPALVAGAVLGFTFLWYGLGYTSGLINVAALAAFYRLGMSDNQRRKFIVVTAATAVTVGIMAVIGDEGWWATFTAAGYTVMAVLFGELIRSRHLLVEEYAARAARASEDAERRVAQERLRIARDVHDLLAHTVSVMTVQAGVASDVIDRDPDAAKVALSTIRQAGREAMGEMQATVSVLRSGSDRAPTAPSPRLDRLDELVELTRDHGIDVTFETDLTGRPLPELVELTAFRVVQESLTNVVRHASATTARIRMHETASSLNIEVSDDGTGAGTPEDDSGFGLRGMAERVESIGGQLRHGRADDSTGWTVRASLPLSRVM